MTTILRARSTMRSLGDAGHETNLRSHPRRPGCSRPVREPWACRTGGRAPFRASPHHGLRPDLAATMGHHSCYAGVVQRGHRWAGPGPPRQSFRHRLRATRSHRGLELTRFRGHRTPWGRRESAMPKTRPPYSPQLRARLIELARSGRTPEELGRQFEPSAQTIRNWLKQADRDDGRRADGLTTEEREEVRRLRREVKALREEREILRKAAAWFARETNSLPSKDSSS